MRAKTIVILMVGFFCGIVMSPVTLWLFVLNISPHEDDVLRNERQSIIPPSLPSLVNRLQIMNTIDNQDYMNKNLEIVSVNVLSGSKTLHTRAPVVYHTYGKGFNDHFKIYTFPTGMNSSSEHRRKTSYINYMRHRENTVDPKTNFIHLLQHICDMKLYNNYHFLLVLRDDTYVQVKNLHSFLNSLLLSSLIPLYIGLRSRNGHCTVSNGILLHHKAFQKICPNINYCMNNYQDLLLLPGEDIVDKCIRSILERDCWAPKQVESLFYHNKESNKLVNSDVLQKAITIHPVTNSEQIVSIHRLVSEMHVNGLLNEVKSVVADVITMDEQFVQLKLKAPCNRKWLWYNSSNVNPKTRHELVTWDYSDSTSIYQLHEHMPSLSLLNRHKSGTNTALQIAIQNLNKTGNGDYIFPLILNECYIAVDESSGMEYILNITVKRRSTNVPLTLVANVLLPLGGPGIAFNRHARDFIQTRINIIVPIANHHNLMPFLEMYENECIKVNAEPVCLHVIFFSHDEVAMRKISQINNIYSSIQIKTYEIIDVAFSLPYAYSYVAELIPDRELMLFFDVNFEFSTKFLSHCRMNTIRNKQTFSPILFSLYKPELVTSKGIEETAITSDKGFFLRYNYQVLCIYRSDFVKVGGYKHSRGTSGNEVIMLVENILKSDVYLMRAIEPFLIKPFQSRNCKGSWMTKSKQESCMKSFADSIGSKTSLASYLLHNGML